MTEQFSNHLLSDYATFLKTKYLKELAHLINSLTKKLNIPIMRLYSHIPDPDLLVKNLGSVTNLLEIMEKQDDISKSDSLFHWELDELPEINKKDVEPFDLLRLYFAQEKSVKAFVKDYTKDQTKILLLMEAIEDYYIIAMERSFALLIPLRMKAIEEQRELERSNESLRQFAAFAAHDLQEPLRMVTKYVQLLEKKYKDKLDQNANDYIHYAVDGSKRMSALIQSLLEFSKITNHSITKQLNSLEIAFAKVLLNLDTLIIENHVKITHDPLPSLKIDEFQIIQVFQNLLFNSIKYRSEQPPYIHIGVQKTGSEWLFCLKDNGIGIEKKDFERIFQMFQRLHGTDLHSGTGIGLTIFKSVIERNGGRVWLESEIGKGTTFYFTLPE